MKLKFNEIVGNTTKEKFSYVVSDLNAYTHELNENFIPKSAGSVRTFDGITSIFSIKGRSYQLNLPNSTIQFAASSDCTVVPSGLSSFNKVVVAMNPVQFTEDLCENTLESVWVSQYQSNATIHDDITFAQYWVDEKLTKIGVEMDKMFWQGNLTGGTGNLALVDGAVELLKKQSTRKKDLTASGLTVSTILADVQKLFALIPGEIADADDLYLFMAPEIFTNLQMALGAEFKYFMSPIEVRENGGFVSPYKYNVRILPTIGLTGTKNLVLAKKSNLIGLYGGEETNPDLRVIDMPWEMKIRLMSRFTMGVGIAYPEQFITNF